jgi:hypothetical protein
MIDHATDGVERIVDLDTIVHVGLSVLLTGVLHG